MPVTEQIWPVQTLPVVSVFNWVYNHVDYIRESIESILVQKTTFPIEIIIHDDASNDGTADIIKEYERKYPHLFRNILHTENQWSQGKSVMTPLFEKPKGKYIALLHGDDLWTDPYKMQKQVEFMEANPDAIVCGGLAEIINNEGNVIDSFKPYQYKSGNLNDVKHKNPLITCTTMFRNPFANIHIPKNISFGDWWLYHDLLQKKGSYFLVENTVYARYRKHEKGITSTLTRIELKQAAINQLHQFSKAYSYRLNKKQLSLLTGSYYKVFKLRFKSKKYIFAFKNLVYYCCYKLQMAIRK